MYLETPGYHAILFRRSLEELNLDDGLIPRSHDWWGGTPAKYNGISHRWTFPNGSTVAFGYMKNPGDHHRYQSAAYQFIGWDQLEQIRELQYRYMFSRLRRLEGSDVPLRMRGTGNPGGFGHEWNKRRFIDPATRPEGLVFIPARLSDNPHLDYDSYVENLMELDPVTRQQLLDGDYSVRPPGAMFDRTWFKLISALPAPEQKGPFYRGCRYWDMAGSTAKQAAYTAGGLIVQRKGDPRSYILDVKRKKGTPLEIEDLIKQTAALDEQWEFVEGVTTVIEQEPGSEGIHLISYYVREVLKGYSVKADKPTGPKDVRAAPLSSAAEQGLVYYIPGPWVNGTLDELEAFPEGEYKDRVDCLSGAFNMFKRKRKRKRYRGEVF